MLIDKVICQKDLEMQRKLAEAKNLKDQNSQVDDSESKMELQDEIFKQQQTQNDLLKQMGKIIRQVNSQKPIKLSLEKLVTK